MFKSFPVISERLIGNLLRQHFLYFVKQYYGCSNGINYQLYSPFKEDYKALHYFERLHPLQQPFFYNTSIETSKTELLNAVKDPSSKHSFVKIIEHNFKLDNTTRYKIASLVQQRYPHHFDLMIKNNFRIVIGDNFGDVFYNVRISQGVLLPVREADLEKFDNYVPRPQQVL